MECAERVTYKGFGKNSYWVLFVKPKCRRRLERLVCVCVCVCVCVRAVELGRWGGVCWGNVALVEGKCGAAVLTLGLKMWGNCLTS